MAKRPAEDDAVLPPSKKRRTAKLRGKHIEGTLLMRLRGKEQEIHELKTQLADRNTDSKNCRSLSGHLNPVVNLFFERAALLLKANEEKLEAMNQEIDGIRFQEGSKLGARMAEELRTLQETHDKMVEKEAGKVKVLEGKLRLEDEKYQELQGCIDECKTLMRDINEDIEAVYGEIHQLRVQIPLAEARLAAATPLSSSPPGATIATGGVAEEQEAGVDAEGGGDVIAAGGDDDGADDIVGGGGDDNRGDNNRGDDNGGDDNGGDDNGGDDNGGDDDDNGDEVGNDNEGGNCESGNANDDGGGDDDGGGRQGKAEGAGQHEQTTTETGEGEADLPVDTDGKEVVPME